MATEAARAGLARKALDRYVHEHCDERRWRHPAAGNDVCECDIVDLMTDLLILARLSGHDPCSVIRKTQVHLVAETGLHC